MANFKYYHMAQMCMHVQLLLKHNYIAYSIIAIQSSNSLKKFHIRGTTIEMDEGRDQKGKIKDRPGNSGTVEAYETTTLPWAPWNDVMVKEGTRYYGFHS